MEKKNLLTYFKSYGLVSVLLILILVLSGCGVDTTPGDQTSTGFFTHYFVYPLSLLIKKTMSLLSGHYGSGIIVRMMVTRLVLLACFIKPTKPSQEYQEKMMNSKPELDDIQKKDKEKSDR